jgi:hypothetical protein
LDWFVTTDSGFSSPEIAKVFQKMKIGMNLAMKPSKDFGINCNMMQKIPLDKGTFLILLICFLII